jgi:hypothetical protein
MLARAIRSADFWAGVLFIAIGAFVLDYSSYMTLGTLSQMGPRYMPVLACWALIGIGAILLVRGAIRPGGEQVGRVAIRPLIVIPTATVVFAVVYNHAGLMAAAVALVLVASFAGLRFRFVEIILLAIGLAALLYAIFIFGLHVNLRPWPG